ncbi:lantibiotic dehydratase [Streptomyces sp. RFCAC02]|uniref:lantibiotic dehydratase n=1 Tax=Streptomyces sp. RFCAC02 TaxID=2499143 RepID=UPI00101FDBB9|nr:lantibiotic dehydratase [Streptomyces sp. RFCAC02]
MTASSGRTPYYRPVPAAVLRASTHAPHMHLPPWPGDDTGAGPWRMWLAAAWSNRTLAEAVALASPVLADRIEQVLAGRPTETVAARRMARALARYCLRLRGRATPFGTFAGVAGASFGPHTAWQWNENHRLRTRADAVWLAAVTARLEAVPELLARLPVQINTLAVARGGRLVVTWQPHQSVRSHRAGEEVEKSVRLIPVMETIRHTALSPIRTADLVDKVAAEHPGAVRSALEQVVGQLVDVGVLISSLRAPATTGDALAHLLNQLHQAGVGDLPQTKTLVGELQLIHAAMGRIGRDGDWETKWDRRVLVHRMRRVTGRAEPTLAVDLLLGANLVLPQAVADEAARAAEALIRLSPQPASSTSWRTYHRDFLTRYGPGVPVPVTELTDSVSGLGFPRHFAEQPGGPAASPRDEVLLALAQQAAIDGVEEIALDAGLLDSLSPGREARRPVTAAELWADLRAETPEAVDAGDFTLGVCGFGRIAANSGRFLDLLDAGDRQKTTTLYTTLPTSVKGAVAAQLSFPPRHPRTENVLRVPAVYERLIPLAEHRTDHDSQLPLSDLAIAADAERLYVVSRSRRQVIEPALPHAGARHTMPPLARLLFETPRSPHPGVTAFDWGMAACLPFRPRVRYGRSILAPAQWRLDPAELPGPDVPMAAWEKALDRLREQRRLPAGVAVGSADRQLRLDLGEAMDRAVLRDHLKAADGPLTVAEAPLATAYGWCQGRAHELVVPLAATASADVAPAFLTSARPAPVTGPGTGPGVVFAKLCAPAAVHDEILSAHLPELLQRWASPPRWWFARYRQPIDHLRIRLHDPDGARAAGYLAAWAERLRQRGLSGEIVFDSYLPETGRYGTGAALAAAEELFAADSAAVLAQLAFLTANRDVHPQALTAASMVDLTGAVTGNRSAGLHWLLDHPQYAATTTAQDRELRRQTLRLAEEKTLPVLPGGADLAAAWAARRAAASRYTNRLEFTAHRLTPGSVLGSLLHMHHNRAAGIDAEAEAVTYKLARAVALSQTRRSTGSTTIARGDR